MLIKLFLRPGGTLLSAFSLVLRQPVPAAGNFRQLGNSSARTNRGGTAGRNQTSKILQVAEYLPKVPKW